MKNDVTVGIKKYEYEGKEKGLKGEKMGWYE